MIPSAYRSPRSDKPPISVKMWLTASWHSTEIDAVLDGLALIWSSRASGAESRRVEFTVVFLDTLPGTTPADLMGAAAFVHDEHGAIFTFAKDPILRRKTTQDLLTRLFRIGAHEAQHAVQTDRGESPTPGDAVFGSKDSPSDLDLDIALDAYLSLPSEVEAREAEQVAAAARDEHARRTIGAPPMPLGEEGERMIAMRTMARSGRPLYRVVQKRLAPPALAS